MTDPNKAALAVILDRSGSMSRIRSDAEGAVNQFVEDQKAQPGAATLTLAQFDHEYELVHDNVPLADVGPVTLHPRGNTALYDAVGRTIGALGAALAALPEAERPGRVLVAIVTDGKENSSTEWTQKTLFDLIEEQKTKWNWEFVYLSADKDAFAGAGAIGIARDQTFAFAATGEGVRAAAASLSSYSASYRSTGKGNWSEGGASS